MTIEPQQNPETEPGLSSPIAHLFAEERHRDLQAREAVFMTFNADLGFFERTVLGIVQATGARVTVLADARINDHDPRAVRNAGVRYLAGVAATASGAAFHPKVNVVVGDDRALLVIGSGNLTGAGWHYNAETWTVVTADRTRCPAIVPEVARWMRSLMDPGVSAVTVSEDAVVRILAAAERLDALAEHAQRTSGALEQTGHRMVHTLDTPILGQLPQPGPAGVRELRMYAPFHDPHCAAVRALIRRYTPARVQLAVQDGGRTILDSQALRTLVEDLRASGGPDIQLFEDRESRYRHGKLIEVEHSDGSGWSLTGSPNLSTVALLRTSSQGGNIEVGILTEQAHTLFPQGHPVGLAELNTVPMIGTADDEQGEGSVVVLILQAVLRPNGLLVSLASSSPVDVTLVVSGGSAYDTWTPIGVIRAGETVLLAEPDACSAGDRIRPEWQTEDGTAAGRATFVTDPYSVLLTARDVIRTDKGRDRSAPAARGRQPTPRPLESGSRRGRRRHLDRHPAAADRSCRRRRGPCTARQLPHCLDGRRAGLASLHRPRQGTPRATDGRLRPRRLPQARRRRPWGRAPRTVTTHGSARGREDGWARRRRPRGHQRRD